MTSPDHLAPPTSSEKERHTMTNPINLDPAIEAIQRALRTLRPEQRVSLRDDVNVAEVKHHVLAALTRGNGDALAWSARVLAHREGITLSQAQERVMDALEPPSSTNYASEERAPRRRR